MAVSLLAMALEDQQQCTDASQTDKTKANDQMFSLLLLIFDLLLSVNNFLIGPAHPNTRIPGFCVWAPFAARSLKS